MRKGIVLLRICLLFLSFLMLFSFSSCKEGGRTTDPYEDLPEIVVGSDEYTPYVCVDENGEFSGLDVELATEAFRRMGYRVRFVRIAWSEKDLLLQNGEVDCIWGCFPLNGREDRYLWAGPYLNSRQVVAVPAGSTIRSLADLANKRIAVQATGKSDEIFSAGTDERIPKIGKLYCFTNIDNVYAALRKGYVDAIADHEAAILSHMKKQTSGEEYVILDESLTGVQIGVAFDKNGDSALVGELSRTLAAMVADGFTEKVLEKYGLNVQAALMGVNGYDPE